MILRIHFSRKGKTIVKSAEKKETVVRTEGFWGEYEKKSLFMMG